MKIEKVSENQIRCTLTKEDLADRQIKLSELAYGTEKAKLLFRDMMQQAAYECGFEAEDIPLMIEAIPLSTDSIILIITKVEYPEELDTRFSQFSHSDEAGYYPTNTSTSERENLLDSVGADDILDLFRKIKDAQDIIKKGQAEFKADEIDSLDLKPGQKKNSSRNLNLTKVYRFKTLDDVTRVSHVLKGFYKGKNILYKNLTNHRYYLVASKSKHTPEEFNKVCNILSEYAYQEKFSEGFAAFLEEHYDTLLSKNALQVLAEL